MTFIMVMITASSKEEGEVISKALLEERLVACANALPINSRYWWKGNIEEDDEIMLLCKTREELLDRIISRVRELHSYDVPEIIALPILGGSKDYLDWISNSID